MTIILIVEIPPQNNPVFMVLAYYVNLLGLVVSKAIGITRTHAPHANTPSTKANLVFPPINPRACSGGYCVCVPAISSEW